MFSPRMLVVPWAVLCCCSLLADNAYAQPNDSNIYFGSPAFLPGKPKAGPPPVKAQPAVWPRLDPGAVFCKSADDLRRLAARRAGEDVAGTIDCQRIQTPIGVSVLHREGPGLVEVQTNNPNAGGVGWTDAWLPDKIPAGKIPAGKIPPGTAPGGAPAALR